MTNFIKILIAFASLIFISSCQKSDTTIADPDKVIITYNTPIEGKTFRWRDIIDFDATISYTTEINAVKIEVIDSIADMVLFEEDHDLHTDKFNLSESWQNTCADSAVLKVKITVAIAHGTAFAEKSIYIHSKP